MGRPEVDIGSLQILLLMSPSANSYSQCNNGDGGLVGTTEFVILKWLRASSIAVVVVVVRYCRSNHARSAISHGHHCS